MALENYVKFLRGTPSAFEKLTQKDKDTLYFISEPQASTGVLYLGDRQIVNSPLNENTGLNDLYDVVIGTNVPINSALVWDGTEWVNKALTDATPIMIGATSEKDGVTGLIPQPLQGQQNLFLRGDGTWADSGVLELTTLINNKADSSKVNSMESALLTLIGEDSNKSVREILTSALIPEDANENLNTVEEVANWIQTQPQELDSMNQQINSLYEIVNGNGENSVNSRIENAFNTFITSESSDGIVNSYKELIDYVSTNDKKIEELQASVDTKEYEISHKPKGTLVNYLEKEIRVMCPKDTEWQLQSSGEGAAPNTYYIGFKAYAPNEATSFKEDLNEIITDNTMYYFENNDFAGIDDLGRKYSIVWLPVARYQEGIWNYFGKSSTEKRFIGWYYSVEWFNSIGEKIHADTIRINLSNEDCHTSITEYVKVDNLIQSNWVVLDSGDADDTDETFI